MSRPVIKAAIFDLDGTLLNTGPGYDRSWYEILSRATDQKENRDPTEAVRKKLQQIIPRLMTIGYRNAADPFVKTFYSLFGQSHAEAAVPFELNERLNTDREAGLRAAFLSAEPMPGAVEALQSLHGHIPLALATGGSRYWEEAKQRDWSNLLDITVWGDDRREDGREMSYKPSATIFQVTLQQLNKRQNGAPEIQPHEVLVFEDSTDGVEGALKAGMALVITPNPNIPRQEFLDLIERFRPAYEKAGLAIDDYVQILDSLEEFNPREWGFGINEPRRETKKA